LTLSSTQGVLLALSPCTLDSLVFDRWEDTSVNEPVARVRRPPNGLCSLHHQLQLLPLIFSLDGLALLGQGKPALGCATELIDIDVFGGILDLPLQIIDGFELTSLGGDETRHHPL